MSGGGTLHTVNRSPFEHGALEGCLARVRPGSAVLLIEDGVLGALAASPSAARLAAAAGATVEVYVLGPDLYARGIEPARLVPFVEVVDYTGFVALACRFGRTVTWTQDGHGDGRGRCAAPETVAGRKRFPIPKLAPGAAAGFVSRRAGPETQRALGFPSALVDDWEAAAVRAMRDVVEERGALRHFLDSCMKCGACTDKCHYFLGTGDPKNMPVARQDLFRDVYRRYHTLSGRLVPWLVGAKKLTPEMLEDWYAYFHQCSQCRRCAVYCPVGIDTAEFAMAAREVMDRIGVGQHYTNEVVEKAGRLGNNLGLPGPALADTLAGLEEDILEGTGVPVRLPLDEPGADILLVTPSADFFAEPHVDGLIGYAKVFHRAGLRWTLSTHAAEAANFALFMGSRDHMAALARRFVEAARTIGANRIVFGECGHAWRVGHNHLEALAGPLDFLARGRVEHVVEVTDELIRRGAVILDPAANDHRRVTYHDSCNIARASRLGDIPGGQFIVPRRVLRAACNHYVEMARNTTREATFCCGAGGGLLADDLMELRVRGAAPRVEAFRAAEVTHLAAMCAICKSQLARVLPEYGFDREQVISVHHLVGDAVRLDPRP